MEDFYFAYGYNEKANSADRLYRRINLEFERYDFESGEWKKAPEQCCIYVGQDVFYDEITEEDAEKVIKAA